MQKVDAKGLICPQTLDFNAESAENCLPGETLKIECDNKTAFQNILTYLKDQSLSPVGTEVEGVLISR